MDASATLLYVVYPQLDALGIDGVARLLGAFASIEDEANRVADSAFEAYGQLPGEGDMGDFADSARDEGIAYYQTLVELRQGVTNLLAVGLYHLFEQHRAHLNHIVAAENRTLPDLKTLPSWSRVDELRLLANTVKHADGSSAAQLRALRPDYFIDPNIRGAVLVKWKIQANLRTANPLGGTDLFVGRKDLEEYRDALRQLWEDLLPHL